MAYAPSAYQHQEILNAPPEKLVQALYQIITSSVAQARACLRQSDIPGRVHHINKAFEALVELSNGLDHSASQEIANTYESIYDYCRKRLVEANTQMSDPILAEVEKLISDLQNAWETVIQRVSAERTARFADTNVLPSETALAGSLDFVG